MEVHLYLSGYQLDDLVDICHQLLGGPCFAGIVAGGLDASGEGGFLLVKAAYVVTLPAMQGDRDCLQPCDSGIGVDAKLCVFCFCFCVTHKDTSICIFKLPKAVASMGSAMTSLPVASAVRPFKNSFFAPPPTIYSCL